MIHVTRSPRGSSARDTTCRFGRSLNHSQIATTERCARLVMDPVREALERNADLMFGTKLRQRRKKR
jgi:hypothetical protein